MIGPLLLIAQTGGQATRQQSVSQAVVWVTILLVVVVIGVAALLHFRKSLFGGGSAGETEIEPVSLHTLRTMHSEGKLSDEEFEQARSAILKMAPGSNPLRDEIQRRAADRDPHAKPDREAFESRYPTSDT
ncbi:MAG: hypothetical protein Tsb0013_06820 [Phycisphaerales bacterium]